MVLKVFFPDCCVSASAGILIGAFDKDNDSVNVVAVIQFPVTPGQLNRKLAKHGHDGFRRNCLLQPLGTWMPDPQKDRKCLKFDSVVPRLFNQKSWICVSSRKHEGGFSDIFIEQYSLEPNEDECFTSGNSFVKNAIECIFVVYNQSEIWNSDYTMVDSKQGAVKGLTQTMRESKQGILTYPDPNDEEEDNVNVSHCCVEREISLVYYLLSAFVWGILRLLSVIILFLRKIFDYFKRFNPVVQFFHRHLKVFSLYSNSFRKISDFQRSTVNLCQGIQKDDSHCNNKDVISSFFMDAVIGTTMLLILYYHGLLPEKNTGQIFLPFVEAIAGKVEELIEWLMGIPAGLKLNDPLNQFLGHFFLYHVRLWLEYAQLVMNLFPRLISYCLYCSCFGFSFFLSIISDIVGTLSFHVYCFYVYAGRLYGLQIQGLLSLWRLFRGKKWNPLRKRVDSLEECGADQLFVGTLLFTVLLFLLPTTALYYAIFALLRIAVFAVQIGLSSVIFIFSQYPWYSTFLRLLQPTKFPHSFQLRWLGPHIPKEGVKKTHNAPMDHEKNQAMVLHLFIRPLAFSTVILQSLQSRKANVFSSSFHSLFGKILTGDLIRWS